MERQEDISVLKREYRDKGKQVRAALSAEERAEKSKAIERRLFQWEPFMIAENASVFMSFRDEVETRHLSDRMRGMGKRL